jgi:hypothetical protein
LAGQLAALRQAENVLDACPHEEPDARLVIRQRRVRRQTHSVEL